MRRLLALPALVLVAACGSSGDDAAAPGTVAETAAPQERCTPVIASPSLEVCNRFGPGENGRFVRTEDGSTLAVALPREPAPNAPVIGHWHWAALSPDGRTLLAHWSSECEVPVAYLVAADGGRPREALPDVLSSFPLGWTRGGRAVVVPTGGCGNPDARVVHADRRPTRVRISERVLWDLRELVDRADGDVEGVLERCGTPLDTTKPMRLRVPRCST